MITLTVTDKTNPQLDSFSDKQWEYADLLYHGRKINWKKESRFIKAYEKKHLVGLLELTLEGGVMHILDLIVAHANQKKGIGTKLMKQAEKLALQEKAHKIFFETGKTWSVRKFYEKLGYTKTGDLPKHYIKEDYVEYTKFLDL